MSILSPYAFAIRTFDGNTPAALQEWICKPVTQIPVDHISFPQPGLFLFHRNRVLLHDHIIQGLFGTLNPGW